MMNYSALRHSAPVAVLLVLLATPAAAEIYKCTDANGSTRYTDTPCGETSTALKKHSAPPASASPDARTQKTRRLLDAMEAERNQEKQAEAEQKAEKERRQRNCNNARDRYQRIVSASRLYDLDEQGNRVTLTDDQRARSTERSRAEVERWCGG
jgi:hypothetical protein